MKDLKHLLKIMFKNNYMFNRDLHWLRIGKLEKNVTRIFKIAAFLLLFSQMSFGKEYIIDPANWKGAGAIPVPIETVVTYVHTGQYVYCSFWAPIDAVYYLRPTEPSYDAELSLLTKKKRLIKSTKGKELYAGNRYMFRIRLGNSYKKGSKFSFAITLHSPYGTGTKPESYEKWTVAERQAGFAKAVPSRINKVIETEITKEKQDFYYRFTIQDTAHYQVRITGDTDEQVDARLQKKLFTESHREIYGYPSLALLPGTYYVLVSSNGNTPGSKFGLVFVEEGEDEWKKEETELYLTFRPVLQKKLRQVMPRAEWLANTLGFIIWLLAMVSVPLIIFFALYMPYVRYLKDEFGFKFFGIPFWILVPCFLGIAFAWEIIIAETMYIAIMIAVDALLMLWVSIDLLRKGGHFLHIPLIIIMYHALIIIAVFFVIYFIILGAIILLLHILSKSGGGGGDVQGSDGYTYRPDSGGSYTFSGKSGTYRRV